jgi:hypothetical protein
MSSLRYSIYLKSDTFLEIPESRLTWMPPTGR